jgi:prepilin-type N-terminal cleavage/methylation domain-containing protein
VTRRGFTLVEVAVAVAVLATAGLALQRLLGQSLRTVDSDVARARTLVAARARLAEAALRPPSTGRESWTDAEGIRTTRIASATGHPSLLQITVRTETGRAGDASELVELVYAPGR